jgi:enamine deaminase RidA (YjgF/YER057c/UK114 family)
MNIRTFLLSLSTTIVLAGPTLAIADDLKTAVNPDHLANTTQYGYSQATVAASNANIIYIAGQIGITDGGPNDFEAQVDRSFENLVAALNAAGGRVDDVVKITLLIKGHNQEKLEYLVKKRREVFGENPPASTLIPVTALALEALEFEVDAIAVTSSNPDVNAAEGTR